jgi:hypothetical protein
MTSRHVATKLATRVISRPGGSLNAIGSMGPFDPS